MAWGLGCKEGIPDVWSSYNIDFVQFRVYIQSINPPQNWFVKLEPCAFAAQQDVKTS